MQASKTTTPHRMILVAFAALPSFDCILAQLNNVFQISIGPLSILQVIRSYLFLVFMTITAWSLVKDHSGFKRVPLPAIGAFLLIGVVVTKEVITTGTLSMASLGSYGQMMYWVMFWITVSILCRERKQAQIILWGLALGATLTALSVIAGLALGGLNYYADDSVRSSSGWFDTSKYITGILVCGGVTILYLGRNFKNWLFPLGAGLCFVACMVTYARAGAVALGAVLLWLPIWWVTCGNRSTRRWLSHFLILAVAALMIVPLMVRTDTLFARWSDLQDPDKAGSGRASFWKIAADTYIEGTPEQQAFGFGFNSMAEMLFSTTGSDIKHTHNDTLDMALVGGVPGVAWLLFFVGTFAWRIFRTSLLSVEGAAGAAILVAYVLHGQFTGQLWSPDAMTYNTLSLTCLYVIGSRPTPEVNPHTIPQVERYRHILSAT